MYCEACDHGTEVEACTACLLCKWPISEQVLKKLKMNSKDAHVSSRTDLLPVGSTQETSSFPKSSKTITSM